MLIKAKERHGGRLKTVPELLFENKRLIPALQQLLKYIVSGQGYSTAYELLW